MLTLPVNISPLQLMMEYEWLRWWEGIGKDVDLVYCLTHDHDFGMLWITKPPLCVDCTEMGLSLHISYSDDICPS